MIRVFDAHADTPYELWIKKEAFSHNSCHIDGEKASHFLSYSQIFAFCSLAGSKWELSPADFRECYEYFCQTLEGHDGVKAHFSIEGPEVINCDPEALPGLREQGFVMSTLTWNHDNVLAGFHKGDGRLTDRGRAYVSEAERCGILLDVSHLSEHAFWDLMRVAGKPVSASHSNCRSLWNHSRNLSDDQLRAISETGGVVGLNLYVPFLGERADFDTLRRHLDHMLNICGKNHVCLGGDLDGCDTLPEGFYHLGSYEKLYDYLRASGYHEELLDAVFYHNLYRLVEGRT